MSQNDKYLQIKQLSFPIYFFQSLPESKMTEIFYDYSKLDQQEVLQIIFHPRREAYSGPPPDNAVDNIITVDEGIGVHARFHLAGLEEPNILFFHGNGEIISDYDAIGPYYIKFGMNFLAVDYRGYGKSSGNPTVTSMLADSHRILDAVKDWLAKAGHTGPLLVMGRSLGAAAALELASNHADDFAGLIIESGFATTLPLLMNLGVDVARLGITEEDGFRNVRKISSLTKPTLIIHGQYDEIIPVNSAAILQAQSPARAKEFQVVPGASHNTVIASAGELYFSMIKQFCNKICGIRAQRRRKIN
jgi:pimeloyl-ACP methyl ester carboxylesterase